MTDQPPQSSQSPLDVALDVLVYAPVGLALTVGEELPKLAVRGRERLQGPLATALVLGRFAAGQGRREMTRRFGAGSGASPSSTASPEPSPPAAATERLGVPPIEVVRPTEAAVADLADEIGAGPPVDSLAIPDYDSLSASQVVQRLGGLSDLELEAVRRYEAAGRGRRTILNRVAQLQAR